MSYGMFLKSKQSIDRPTGLKKIEDINDKLFDFQRDIVTWALKRGRAAIFADCGLGKTPMQLEWARQIPGNVLILAPLAVSQQTVREGVKFGIEVKYCRNQEDVVPGITITNYEMLEHFEASFFNGVVLDESSILKAYSGKIRNHIIESFKDIPYKLACTATPAPNDYMELGNHSEFLGVMSRSEMLSMFFVHDGGETQKWRLKGHAENNYWEWLCSWAVMLRKPSDLGYEDTNFKLPSVDFIDHKITTNKVLPGELFVMEAQTLQERQRARRDTTEERTDICADIVNKKKGTWLIWCNLNYESVALTKKIKGAVQITGSDSRKFKEDTMLNFSKGKIKVLISKPSLCGYGMNWQHCSNMAFVGLSDSYEQFYQAVRRCWRFGQKKPVDVHIITADIEGAVVKNIKRKERDASRMAENMVAHMHTINEKNIKGTVRQKEKYKPTEKMEIPSWL